MGALMMGQGEGGEENREDGGGGVGMRAGEVGGQTAFSVARSLRSWRYWLLRVRNSRATMADSCREGVEACMNTV